MFQEAEILIIGGGIAGLSTACHLARAGQGGVVLVERETLPGFYASGHNAGIARRLTGRAEHTALTVPGADLLAQAGLLRAGGGYLLGAEPGGTRALAEEARTFGLEAGAGTGSPVPGSSYFATSTPSITEIPTFAVCRDGASLMPSPM